MIYFHKFKELLVLEYKTSQNFDASWVDEKLENNESATIAKTFYFRSLDLIKAEKLGFTGDARIRFFKLGLERDEYYLIRADILGLKHDLKISKKLDVRDSIFIAYELGSVFKKIDRYTDEPISIGGNDRDSISIEDFENILKNFPTKTEITHYVGARIQRLLGDYFETMLDSELKLKKHLERKKKLKIKPNSNLIAEYEIIKFEFYLNQLKEMLEDAESYAESDWQKNIIEIILAIYPKYVSVLEDVHIKDFYSNASRPATRYIDLALVDAIGNLDIIEIKRPFENKVLSKGVYRGNFVPHKELSGAIMQAEKYLFHLNKWGVNGEKEITRKHRSYLPECIDVRITNPKSIIILGRSNAFESKQDFDFEIIKRKYSSVIDIITYDDLLVRLENIINQLKKRA